MTSFRQIEANRRNAQLSTGPGTEEGKRRSRQNAVRHGLTAETVIDALEDVDDYAAFEMAITTDYDAQSAVERELVLRLASLLWRLRRATAIQSGLFKIQAIHLLQFRRRRQAHQERQKIIDGMYRDAVATNDDSDPERSATSTEPDDKSHDQAELFRHRWLPRQRRTHEFWPKGWPQRATDRSPALRKFHTRTTGAPRTRSAPLLASLAAPLNLRVIMQCRQQERSSVDAGGLMSYSGDARDAYYEVGAYTGRVLKARGRPIYLSNRLPRLSWSSTSRQPERLG
jgi:hypothetical protein